MYNYIPVHTLQIFHKLQQSFMPLLTVTHNILKVPLLPTFTLPIQTLGVFIHCNCFQTFLYVQNVSETSMRPENRL